MKKPPTQNCQHAEMHTHTHTQIKSKKSLIPLVKDQEKDGITTENVFGNTSETQTKNQWPSNPLAKAGSASITL